MLVSVAKTLIFLPIILIQRADCGSNLPVVPYGRKWFRPLRKEGLRTLLSRDAAGTGLGMGRAACRMGVCFCSGRPGNEPSNSCANYG